MSYFPCAKACWTKLITSVVSFFSRTVSQFWKDVKTCWKESYRHCVENCDCYFCWCRVKAIACIVWQTIENIVCTVVSVLVTIISVISYTIVFVFAVIRCTFLPCPLPSKKQPAIDSCENLWLQLRKEVNEELTWYDKLLAPVFTPFKETGLSNSWDAYNYWVMAKGEVIHDAYSRDGLETIDIQLITLAVYENERRVITAPLVLGDSKCNWKSFDESPRFIRAEVFPQVFLAYKGARPQVSDKVIIKGRLMWDRDGWLEIHPKFGSDLQIIA